MHILLGDDDRIVHRTIGGFRTESGHDVASAHDATRGLELIRENEYDLALVDIRMPGMDGLALLEKAQEVRPELSIVIVTAFGNMELVMFRKAAELRLFPALSVNATGTRKEELLFPDEKHLEKVWSLRRKLSSYSDMDALKSLLDMIRKHPTNQKLLDSIIV